MRQTKSGPGLSKRTFLGLLLTAALAPAARPYINGVKIHDTRQEFQSSLKNTGWSSAFLEFAEPIPHDCDRTGEIAIGVKVTPPDNPAFRKYVNELVAQAIRFLPEKEAATITVEQKREVARATTQALREAVSGKRQVEKTGRTGSLAYRVGTFPFETTREVHEGNRLLQRSKWKDLAPFVALKIVDAKQ